MKHPGNKLTPYARHLVEKFDGSQRTGRDSSAVIYDPRFHVQPADPEDLLAKQEEKRRILLDEPTAWFYLGSEQAENERYNIQNHHS